jgi:hypothetical protein
LNEVSSGLNVVDVHKNLSAGKMALQAVGQTPGPCRTVLPTVADEDLTAHFFLQASAADFLQSNSPATSK